MKLTFYFLSVVPLKMAIVLIDNEAFKATLQIVEDFINDDYDAFIENGPTDDIKLITWKMEIYFKRLEGKKNSIVEYYMLSIYKLIKVNLYQKNGNGHISYIEHNNGSYLLFSALTLDFEKNIPAKTITIKFICNETYKINKSGYNYTYLNHIQCILNKLKSVKDDQKCIRDCTLSYYKPNEIEFTNKSISLSDNNITWLKDIIKIHYQEILKNIEAYILYCKTEKIDIDFKKIVDRITYIKQYVKDNYNITLV